MNQQGEQAKCRSPVPSAGEDPELLSAISWEMRVPGAEAAWKLGDAVVFPSNSVSRRPLPQEDVTICCAGAHCQGDKIFMAALSCFPFQATVTYLLQIYAHV